MNTMNDPPKPTGKRVSIVLDAQSVKLLLDSQSSPFVGPHLHPEAADRIMIEARSFPWAEELSITFRVPKGNDGHEAELQAAVRKYGRDAQQNAAKEVKEILKDGWFSLWIGLIAVVVFLAIAEVLPLLGEQRFLKAMSESLIIFYWVILWRPAELLLYEHIPPRRRRRVASLLSRADVRVETIPAL